MQTAICRMRIQPVDAAHFSIHSCIINPAARPIQHLLFAPKIGSLTKPVDPQVAKWASRKTF
jgi:hypothetical protein